MNAVDEYSRTRVTLGFAAKNYGFEVVPAFAADVTITSIAHDVRKVRPGCLYVPIGHIDRRQLEAARDAGAYAALVTPELRSEAAELGMPLLVSSVNPVALGKLACDINADPSSCVATFAVAGDDDDDIHANVIRLADFLHMLGNPVGIISDAGSSSLQRELSLQYPLHIADVQHVLSVCVEDGAAAVVIALNSATLSKNALQSVNIDVLGAEQTHRAAEDASSSGYATANTKATEQLSLKAPVSAVPPVPTVQLTPTEPSASAEPSTSSQSNSSIVDSAQAEPTASQAASASVESASQSSNDSQVEKVSSDTLPAVAALTTTTSLLDLPPAAPTMSFYSLRQRYGFCSRDHAYCVTRSADSDELAALADQIGGKDVHRHLSLSIAMVLAAGVRRGTIKSALRVSHELR